MVEYRIVWVTPKNPEYVEDIYADELPSLSAAREFLEDANKYTTRDDGLDWIPRIQSVTYSFIE